MTKRNLINEAELWVGDFCNQWAVDAYDDFDLFALSRDFQRENDCEEWCEEDCELWVYIVETYAVAHGIDRKYDLRLF